MSQETERKSLPWRRRLVFLLIAVIGISVAARVLTSTESASQQPASASQKSGATPAPGSAFLPGTTPGPAPTPEEKPAEKTPAQEILPYLTEGGIAMLIGIGLGMATRTVARIFLLLFAVFFIGVQILASKGIVSVDWGAFTTWLRQFVLNISGENGLGAIVQHKLPSAGSLVIGYYIGLKKG